MADFFLISHERREPYAPRACRILKRLRTTVRDDLALVEIDPPLPRHVYNTDSDLAELILASRLGATSLFPISEWPTHVYICVAVGAEPSASDFISHENFRIVDWGGIYPSERAASEENKSTA